MQRQKIAVVGSGIAGLGAAWLLSRRHDVCVFEQNGYVGGHTNTRVVDEGGRGVPVDTGFIVFNHANYPSLTALFDHLGVATRPSNMSFAVSVNSGELEYAGSGLNALYAQRRNFVSRAHQGMVWDIFRFNRACKRDLARNGFGRVTIDEYLRINRLGATFRNRYLLPMAAAIWSCPTETMGAFPAASLARFFANHGLIDLFDRPQWRTVVGGSHVYVRHLLADAEFSVLTNAGVERVERHDNGVALSLRDGRRHGFDQVVLAGHADQSLAVLADPTPRERSLLSQFSYQDNRALLHTDERLMPRDRRVWSAWNYLAEDASSAPENGPLVSVTYWMNRLQDLPTQRNYFVTLNPLVEPRPELVVAEQAYTHPVFDGAAIATQPRLARLQGHRNTWFCGSYFGWGFHEDAFTSAIEVARALGVMPPWQDEDHPSAQDKPVGYDLRSREA